MKILALDSTLPLSDSSLKRVRVIPDSSIQKGDRPFFIPDMSHSFEIFITVALRIDKAGKPAVPRFSRRYVEAIAPAVNFVDVSAEQEGWSTDYSRSFFPAVALGEFRKLNAEDVSPASFIFNLPGATVSLNIDGDVVHAIDQAVYSLGHRFTFKTGDIVFPFLVPTGTFATRDFRLTASDGDDISIAFNIK